MDTLYSDTINKVLYRILLATCCFCLLTLPGFAEQPPIEEVSLGVLRAGLQKTQFRTLDLEEALNIALEQNPTMRVAADARKQAKARYWGALADFLPDIGVNYTISGYDGVVQGPKATLIPLKRTTVAPQLYFRFNVLQGGAQIFLARHAKRTLEAQKFSEQATIQEILHETAVRYYEMERRLADLKAAQLQLREAQENLSFLQNAGISGGEMPLAALQLETQVIDAQEQLVAAEGASQEAAVRLNELLVLPAFVETLPEGEQNLHTLIPGHLNFQTCLERAHTDNPRLKALTKQLVAMQQLLRGAMMTGLMPEGSAEFNIGGLGASQQELGRVQSNTVRIGVVSRNMGMDSFARFREYKAQLSSLKNQIAELKNALQRTVSEAHVQTRAKQTQLSIIRNRLLIAEQTRQAAIGSLKNRTGYSLDIIQAQTMLNKTRYQLNENILAYNRAQADLVYAMGVVSVDTLSRGLQSTSMEISHSQNE